MGFHNFAIMTSLLNISLLTKQLNKRWTLNIDLKLNYLLIIFILWEKKENKRHETSTAMYKITETINNDMVWSHHYTQIRDHRMMPSTNHNQVFQRDDE